MFGTEKMERDIGLFANYPTVVAGPDVKQIPSLHLVVAAVFHLTSRAPGHNQTDVFHLAERRSSCCSHVFRPFPSRLITSPADRHCSDLHGLHYSIVKCPHLIMML